MNYVGKIKAKVARELQKKYGTGTWDAAGMIHVSFSIKDDDDVYLKLQGKYMRQDCFDSSHHHPMPTEFVCHGKEKFEGQYENIPDYMGVDYWVDLYEKNK